MTSSFGSADLIVIGEPSDRVASEVFRRSHEKGLCVEWPERSAFARGTSIMVDGAATVDPDVPVLLRRQAVRSGPADDSRFLAAEAHAQLWAAAALMKSPVVNRPSLDGTADWHPRIQVTRLRSGGTFDPLLLIPERHTDTARLPSADYESEPLSLVSSAVAGCGYRYRRRKPADWRYERCCVVGDRVLSSTGQGRAATLSRLVATALKVEFCLIHWRIDPAGKSVELARVNTHPDAAELGGFFDAAIDLLMELLLR